MFETVVDIASFEHCLYVLLPLVHALLLVATDVSAQESTKFVVIWHMWDIQWFAMGDMPHRSLGNTVCRA